MLAGPRLGDDARLAHAPRQQRLPDTVIDLVRAGVVEVLALQIDPGTAGLTCQPFGKGQGGWAAHIVLQVVVKLPLKLRVLTGVFIMFGELPQRVHERFRNEATAIRAEATLSIGDGRSGNGHGNVTLKRKTNGAAALAAGIDLAANETRFNVEAHAHAVKQNAISVVSKRVQLYNRDCVHRETSASVVEITRAGASGSRNRCTGIAPAISGPSPARLACQPVSFAQGVVEGMGKAVARTQGQRRAQARQVDHS